jgi:ABC-type polysaccharide/polyol phosphate transport system ATPase subunit
MSYDNVAIKIDQASKCYHVYNAPVDRLKQFILPRLRSFFGLSDKSSYFREFWSLRKVSLTVNRGEVLGLVGANGAGKSTLLQLICGVLQPSDGLIQVNGRVAALLELGAGFNPEFSGRENIYLNAALLGLTEEETNQHLDGIIQFSGLSEFIDQPVKTYSSGMYVRLAFSIATSVQPDILIIDEALSVGDGAFARKSFDRILAMRDQGVTIIFCSHSLFQVEALCTRALWLDAGRVREIGPVAQVTASYQEHLDHVSNQSIEQAIVGSIAAEPLSAPKGYATLRKVQVSCDGVEGKDLNAISGRSEVVVDFEFDSDPSLPAPSGAVAVTTFDGRIVASCGSWIDGVCLLRDSNGRGTVSLKIVNVPLLKARYRISAYLFCERGLHIYTSAEGVATLNVAQENVEQGLFHIPRTWQFVSGHHAPSSHASPYIKHKLNVDDSLPQLKILDNWSDRWETRWATREDLEALQLLFKESFKYEMSPIRWLWKYQGAKAWGTAVQRDGHLVGFYGGMPRLCVLKNEPIQAVQIGDVMVAPDERAAGRSGPLMRASASYIDNMPALYPGFAFAFGFPSERPMRLGVALGLYRPVESINEVVWPALPNELSSLHRLQFIDNDAGPLCKEQINVLWALMRHDFSDYIVPVRDKDRWLYRYVSHPEITYKLAIISNTLSNRPLAAFVMVEHPDFIELVDYVGGVEGVELAVQGARHFADSLGQSSVKGWFSNAIVSLFEAQCSSMTKTGIEVPVSSRGKTKEQAVLPAPLWLMAGDTDFR